MKLSIKPQTYPVFSYKSNIYLNSFDIKTAQQIFPLVGDSLITCVSVSPKEKEAQVLVKTSEEFNNEASSELQDYINSLNNYISQVEEYCAAIQRWINIAKNERKKGNTAYTQQMISDQESALVQAQELLAKAQRQLKEAFQQRTIVSNEWGRFSPPNTININFLPELANNPNQMLEVIAHEQLHYQTSQPNKSLLSFFEEGLTQHFTLKILRKASIKGTAISPYPYPVFIIRQMMKKIPESTWFSIYQSKDAAKIEKSLDETYGAGFYKKYQNYFIMITYGNSADSVEYTNAILRAIGEPELLEDEVYNKYQWN